VTLGHREFWNEWYEVVTDDKIRQGDIYRGLTVYWLPADLPVFDEEPPPTALQDYPAKSWTGDWIVMSASCDLERGPEQYPHVLVGRILPATGEFLGVDNEKELKRRLEVVRTGRDHAKFLVAEHPDARPPFERSIVQYKVHLTLPHQYLRSARVHPRLRLKPPFREKFGNWVGANISRVGIAAEDEIPAYKVGMSAGAILSAGALPEPVLAGTDPSVFRRRSKRFWGRLSRLFSLRNREG
jgi:hypothetical protein